jgi:hypothetical protein
MGHREEGGNVIASRRTYEASRPTPQVSSGSISGPGAIHGRASERHELPDLKLPPIGDTRFDTANGERRTTATTCGTGPMVRPTVTTNSQGVASIE